ncbi:Voltage-dependent chloride channel 1, chloroplastic, variant 2 [Dionaea muscipula]
MSKPRNSISPPLKKQPSTSNFTPRTLLGFRPSPLSSKPINKFPFLIQCCDSQKPSPKETTPLISILRRVPDWADGIKESGMQKKRLLYDHEQWVQHRSSIRHVRHLFSSLTSRVILSLIPPVTFFTSVAVIVAGYNSAVTLHWLPEFLPLLRAPSLPYQLTAPALALLLVFRTEASYSRFEEGRKAWTKVIAGTNDFARQVIASVDGLSNAAIKNALLQYIMAFPVALKCHLIYGSDARRDLQKFLDADDLDVVLCSKHRPRCIIEFISQSLKILKLEESKRNMLESKITCFHEGIGVCEELVGIPIPLSYTRLTSRILVLWHLTLPIILWDDCQWIVVPGTFISAASLFCIEEVGVLIEEPFPMLPLDELCKVVSSEIQGAVANEKVIQARVESKRKHHDPRRSSNGRPNSELV